MMNRDKLIKLIHAARIASRHDFASTIAADWLASWPGDVEVQVLLAQVEMEQLHPEPAAQRLHRVVTVDPEYMAAYDLLAGALHTSGEPTHARVYRACAEILRGAELSSQESPSWAINLMKAITALSKGDVENAISESRKALTADPDIPLVTLIAIKTRLTAGEHSAALALARAGHDRWPECLPFHLLLAEDLIAQGDLQRGVAYLHRVASNDPLGQVTERFLGSPHPYQSLWASELKANIGRPVPAEVAAVLGDNRLSGGSLQPTPSSPTIQVEQPAQMKSEIRKQEVPKQPRKSPQDGEDVVTRDESFAIGDDSPPQPEPWESFRGPDSGNDLNQEVEGEEEMLLEVEQEFVRLASRVNARRRIHDEEGRVPAYIILSSHTRLVQAFGEDGFQRLDETIMSMVESIRRRIGWTAYRIYIDDPSTLESFGLTPADPGNAWQIKLRLSDLDQILAQRGEMIGAVLIVGGERIVPFHSLPNPTDDDDEIVPSDNPYSTTDENYFAPEWAIGRLPSNDDPDILIRLLRTYAEEHRLTAQAASPLMRLRVWFATKLDRFFNHRPRALGYTASIWRKASMAVFKVIGEPNSMLTSPPTEADRLPSIVMRPARFSYFNLHGLEDAPEWFGQRDPIRDEGQGPEFPIALRPQDIMNSGSAPKVVFTEACYGANIHGKSNKSALCLKFMDTGSRAIIGSTKISYGSVTTPLIAADLLGRYFWEHLNQSLPVGEALRRAKLKLAAEMHRRQGFLDGEDQKTIISFVLYGDPLYCPAFAYSRPGQKIVIRRRSRPTKMKTVCSLGECTQESNVLDPVDLDRIKAIVSQYLPGMVDAQCRIHPQHLGCDADDHFCPSHQLGIKKLQSKGQDNLVVTFSKHVQDGALHHPNYARLTLDPTGKVLKLAVSR